MEAISDARSPPKIKVNRLLESAKVRTLHLARPAAGAGGL